MSAVASMPADGRSGDFDAVARAFLDSLPSRLRLVRARSPLTREDLPARSGCEEGDVVLGEAAQRVWDAETASARAIAARYRALAALIEHEGGETADDVDTLRAATALRMTHGAAHWELRTAHRAVHQLPHTLARLEQATFPSWWFQKVLRESEDLGEESRRLLDVALATWPADIPAERFLTLLRALVRLLAAREQEISAPEEAPVREVELVRDGPAGTGTAALRGPVPEVLAFWKRLDEAARAIQAAQRRALREGTEIPYDLDGIVTATRRPVPLARLRYTLVLNAEFDTEGVHVPEPRFRLNVTVPVFTLLGLSDAPGMVEGTIPIPPAIAREIAGGVSLWHRVLTDPCSGAFLPLPAQRYAPTPDMLEHLRLRNASCAVPGCTRPVSWASEADHIEEFDHADPSRGGRTELENLHLLCWQHHQAKTAGDLDPARPASPATSSGGREPGRTRWRLGDQGEQIITADDIDLTTRLAVEDLERAWRTYVERRSAPSTEARAPDPPPRPVALEERPEDPPPF